MGGGSGEEVEGEAEVEEVVPLTSVDGWSDMVGRVSGWVSVSRRWQEGIE